MKRATSICTTIIVALLLLASAKGTAQPASTNQLSSMVTLTRIPPVQMVNSILISPDGKRIATLRGEGTSWNSGGKPLNLQVWEVRKGDLLWTARERARYLFAFSPDGKHLVGIAEDTTLAFWDTTNRRVKSRLRKKNLPVSAAAFLPDGRTLVTTVTRWGNSSPMQPIAGELQLWGAKTGRFNHALKAQTNAISALAVSPDGSTLAIANEFHGFANTVNILDIATDSVRHTLRFGTNVWMISSKAFSPDGKTLAAEGGAEINRKGEVRLWDVSSGKLKRSITEADVGAAPIAPIWWGSHVAFFPDGEVLAIMGENHRIDLWSVADNKWRGSFGYSDPPDLGRYVIQFVPEGLLLAGVNRFQQVEVK